MGLGLRVERVVFNMQRAHCPVSSVRNIGRNEKAEESPRFDVEDSRFFCRE